MSGKLEIKYLIHGTIEVDKPIGWDDMQFEDRKAFLVEKMINTDPDILLEGTRPMGCVEPNAVVDADDEDNEYSILSPIWEEYVFSGTSNTLFPAGRRK